MLGLLRICFEGVCGSSQQALKLVTLVGVEFHHLLPQRQAFSSFSCPGLHSSEVLSSEMAYLC